MQENEKVDTETRQGRQGTNSETSEVTPYMESDYFSDEEDEELDPEVLKRINQIALMNIVEKENKRFCAHCQMFKVTYSYNHFKKMQTFPKNYKRDINF